MISAGDYLYVLKNDGTIWFFDNGWEQRDGISDVKMISAGNYLYVLKNDGTIWFFNNRWNQRVGI